MEIEQTFLAAIVTRLTFCIAIRRSVMKFSTRVAIWSWFIHASISSGSDGSDSSEISSEDGSFAFIIWIIIFHLIALGVGFTGSSVFCSPSARAVLIIAFSFSTFSLVLSNCLTLAGIAKLHSISNDAVKLDSYSSITANRLCLLELSNVS